MQAQAVGVGDPAPDFTLPSAKHGDFKLSSLRGKSLQIPVRGSLTQPQLDARVLEGLAREAFTAPVENVLEKELQKGLDKGFGKDLEKGLNRFLPGKK